MPKKENHTLILDTNVLLIDSSVLERAGKTNDIIIPLSIVNELDRKKTGTGTEARNCRQSVRILESVRVGEKKLRIHFYNDGSSEEEVAYADPYILRVATKIRDGELAKGDLVSPADFKGNISSDVKIITNDLSLRIQAKTRDLMSEPYKIDGLNPKKLEYKGFSKHDENKFSDKDIKKYKTKPNHLFVVGNSLCRVTGDDLELTPVTKDNYTNVHGISAKNDSQRAALTHLLDPNISLISLVGSAGTGKTLLALAAAVKQLFDEDFNNLSVGRAIIPLGKDLGALPGTAEEKVRPYLTPIYDNLEVIFNSSVKITRPEKKEEKSFVRGNKSRETAVLQKSREQIQQMEEEGDLIIQPTGLMRGRTLNKVFMIVDESQNLTPHEIKTIITRAGQGCKIVLLGDPKQIDTPHLDYHNNGLSFIIDAFTGQKCFANVTLDKVERSELARIAVKLLKL